MRAKFEGAFHPGAGIAFDASNTMDGGYAEATPEAQQGAARVVLAHVPDAEAHDILEMLGIDPPRPQAA